MEKQNKSIQPMSTPKQIEIIKTGIDVSHQLMCEREIKF